MAEKNSKEQSKDNLLTSLLLVFPLLVFYEIGVRFTDKLNGADFITITLLKLVGSDGYFYVQAALVVAYLGLVLYVRRRHEFIIRHFIPVVLESGVYALTMGTLIIFVMVDLLGIDPRLAAGTDPLLGRGVFDRLVMAVGAGVHEELVFRLLLLNALIFFNQKVLDLRPWLAIALAFVVSSLLFAGAHHIGPLGESLRLGVFTYRAMAGLFFAALYQFRSFSIAVYTHAIYDAYVFLLH